MITNLILLVVLILIVLGLYALYRNDNVYCFVVSLNGVLFDELERILNTYKDDDEFHEDKNNYNHIKEKIQFLSDKHSYNKYLFSFKPSNLKNGLLKKNLSL